MKTIKVTEIPKCDLCDKPAAGLYDTPIGAIGNSWGNLCEECLDSSGSREVCEQIGSKRIIGAVAPTNEDKELYEANDISDPMDILAELCNRELECPQCGETKEVEPDFSGEYQCEGCGRRLHAESLC